MAIAPINGFSARNNYNSAINFGSKNYLDDYEQEQGRTRNSSKLNKMVSVPVGVLLALSPSLLNAHQPSMNVLDSNTDKTEYVVDVAKAQESSGVDALFETEQSKRFLGSEWLASYRIQYYEKFKPTNSSVNQNIVYSAYKYNGSKEYENYVNDVYLVPEGYKSQNDQQAPPKVTHLVFHDLGEGKEFCGLVTCEYFKKGRFIREFAVPEKIANKVIDLMVGDSEYTNRTGIKLIKTKSADTIHPYLDEYEDM